MKEFLREFTSDKAIGEDGYLTDKGLIPLPDKEFSKFKTAARKLTILEALN